MRLDIGIASYGSHQKLQRTMQSIRTKTVSDWRCFVIDNPGPDPMTRPAIEEMARVDQRFVPVWMEKNEGYAGAVNRLFELAETEFIAYCDNDIRIDTLAWDTKMLEPFYDPKVGQVFPGAGHFGHHNGRYHECLWNAGYHWILRRAAMDSTGPMDAELGHHEEVDYMIRLRLKGWLVACRPDVATRHDENSTRSPESAQRIHDGVVRWMNKWNRYFCGDALEYSMTAYDGRALRYTDWPPCALYLERYFLHKAPHLNKVPATIEFDNAGKMDLIQIPKPKDCYIGRAI